MRAARTLPYTTLFRSVEAGACAELAGHHRGRHGAGLDIGGDADAAQLAARRQEAAARGKLRGIGIATYIEACAMAPSVMAGQLGARAGFYRSEERRVGESARRAHSRTQLRQD